MAAGDAPPAVSSAGQQNGASNETHMRETASYDCKDERFTLAIQRYSRQQYSQIYYQRLLSLRSTLRSNCQLWWPSLPVRSVLELEEGLECVVIGTLYKHMQLKPSILDDYAKERSSVPLATPSKFVANDDYLVLEDEGGRVRLTGDCIQPGSYVTGIVVAVRGRELKNGEFGVTELQVPGLPPQAAPSGPGHTGPNKYVALVSGLSLGGSGVNPLEAQLLVDHLVGHLGSPQDQQLSASVVRTVLAGDSSSMSAQQDLLSAQVLSARDGRSLAGPLGELDVMLAQLASAMPVDIMPGASDPSNFALPQQPLHACLVPGARQYSTLTRATNPHAFDVDGINFLGTSGQNVDDLRRYMEVADALELLELSLRWQHVAPTAPDTLGCYPFVDADPFVIETCPHVYFCGNQPQFATRLVEGPQGQRVRLVCIPRFAESGQAVLVELGSLNCHVLHISTSALH